MKIFNAEEIVNAKMGPVNVCRVSQGPTAIKTVLMIALAEEHVHQMVYVVAIRVTEVLAALRPSQLALQMSYLDLGDLAQKNVTIEEFATMGYLK